MVLAPASGSASPERTSRNGTSQPPPDRLAVRPPAAATVPTPAAPSARRKPLTAPSADAAAAPVAAPEIGALTRAGALARTNETARHNDAGGLAPALSGTAVRAPMPAEPEGGAGGPALGPAGRGPLLEGGDAGAGTLTTGPFGPIRPGDTPRGGDDPTAAPGVPGGATREAQAASRVMPSLAGDLRTGGGRKTVRVRVEVAADGTFEAAVEESSGDPEIDRRVLVALRRWTWTPALENGLPVASVQRLRFDFEGD